MGPAISQDEIRTRRWSRDISKIFNCAKIADPIDFRTQFVKPLTSPSGKLLYALISEGGDVAALSHDTLLYVDGFRLRLPAASFVHIAQFSPRRLVLASRTGVVFVLSNDDTEFSVTQLSVAAPRLCLSSPADDYFLVVSNNAAVVQCRVDGTTTAVWGDQGTEPFDAAFVDLGHIAVVVSTADGFLIGAVRENSAVVRHGGLGLRRIVTVTSNGIFGISLQRDEVVSLRVGDDLAVQETVSVASGRGYVEVAVLDDHTVIGCREKEIFTFAANQYQTCDLSKAQTTAGIDRCIGFLTFPGQTVVVVICGNGNLLVCRATDVSNRDPYLQKRLHVEPIVAYCLGADFSFLTVDAAGNPILWENIPDWWDAPYHSKLFQDHADPPQ